MDQHSTSDEPPVEFLPRDIMHSADYAVARCLFLVTSQLLVWSESQLTETLYQYCEAECGQ